MKTIDEEIWSYIDGSCTDAERVHIEQKIATDEAYRVTFKELKQLNALLEADELEEPSMSFNRNVMDAVALEIAPKKLSTRINNNIIYGIAAFFILSLAAILGYAIANSSPGSMDFKMPTVDLRGILNPTYMKIFLMFDVVLALVYLDHLLRRKMHSHQQ